MSAAIGQLNVQISANPAGAIAGFDATTAAAERFQKSLSGTDFDAFDAGLRGIMATLAGAVAGLTALAASQINAIDESTEMASRLDISTEALTTLQVAAELAGASQEDMALSLVKLQREIGAAAGGSEEAVMGFARLGFTAEELSGIPLDQAFEKIAQRISEIPNASERARAAFDVFGKSGAKLADVLKGGAGGIAEARAEAEASGFLITGMDAAKIGEVDKEFNRLKFSIQGAGRALATEFAPEITSALQGIVGLVRTLVQFWREWGDQIKAAAKFVVGAVAAWVAYKAIVIGVTFAVQAYAKAQTVALALTPGGVAKLALGLAAAGVAIAVVDKAFASSADSIKKADAAVAAGTPKVKERSAAILEMLARQKEVAAAAKDLDSALQKAREDAAFAGSKTPQADRLERRLANARGGLTDEDNIKIGELRRFEDLKRIQEFAKQVVSDTQTPTEKINEQIAHLNEALRAGEISWGTYGLAVEKAKDELFEAQEAARKRFGLNAPLLADSKEAFSAILRLQRRDAINPEGRLVKIGEDQKKLLQKNIDALRELIDLNRQAPGGLAKGDLGP